MSCLGGLFAFYCFCRLLGGFRWSEHILYHSLMWRLLLFYGVVIGWVYVSIRALGCINTDHTDHCYHLSDMTKY